MLGTIKLEGSLKNIINKKKDKKVINRLVNVSLEASLFLLDSLEA